MPRPGGQDETRASTGRHPSTRRLEPGAYLDDYEILEVIGRGSMGRVYRARDPLGRLVAIKTMVAEVADEEGLIRFQREGEAMAAVPAHRNVVTVHTTGIHRGSPYLVLDFVAGQSLQDLLKSGPLPAFQGVDLVERLCRALEHIHRSGVHHRDLKPANIMIRGEDGEPVVTDFGMAGLRGADRLTRTGDLLGTPLYMAPEQILGLKVAERADVWALGVLLFEVLAGQPPFRGKSLVEVTQAITSQPLPDVRQHCPAADAGLVAILQRALAKRASDRYANPAQLGDALAGWLVATRGESQQAPPPAPPPSRRGPLLTALGRALLAGLGYLGVLLWPRLQELPAFQPSPLPSPAAARSARPAPQPSQAPPPELHPEEVEALSEAIDFRRPERVQQELKRLRRARPEARLIGPVAAQLYGSCLSWCEDALSAWDVPPSVAQVEELIRGLRVLNQLRALSLEQPEQARSEALARLCDTAFTGALSKGFDADAATALCHAFVELGEARLPLPRDSMLLTRFWESWALPISMVMSDEGYIRVLRAGVQLELPLHHNMLYGGATRLLDAALARRVLAEDDLVNRYLLVRIGVATGTLTGGRAYEELLAAVRADPEGLPRRHRAKALALGTRVSQPAEALRLLEEARALEPRDPWLMREHAVALSARGDPSAPNLAEQAWKALETEGYLEQMVSAWEQERFLQTVIEISVQGGEFERARTRIEELVEEDPEDGAAGCITAAAGALESGGLDEALIFLLRSEELMGRVRGAWRSQDNRVSVEQWEATLTALFSRALQAFQQAKRPDLAERVIAAYEATGRAASDATFQALRARSR